MATVISHKYKFLFIHIPKTAGKSITQTLFSYLDIKIQRHVSIKSIWEDKYNNYFKFSIVRNPWDRMVSNYFYQIQYDKNSPYLTNFNNCEYWLKRFDEVKIKNSKNIILRPQHWWLEDINGNMKIDYVIKFENLQNDYDFVCNKIGIPLIKLPHKNKTKRNHYSYYYDDKTIEKIAKIFEKDIKIFNYKFERI